MIEYPSVTRINSDLDKEVFNMSFSITKIIDCKTPEYLNIIIDKFKRLKLENFNRIKIPNFDWSITENVITLTTDYIKGFYAPTNLKDSQIIYEDVVLHKSDWTFYEYALPNFIKDIKTGIIYSIDFLGYCYVPDIDRRIKNWNSERKKDRNLFLKCYHDLENLNDN